jgi:hypothetical protein
MDFRSFGLAVPQGLVALPTNDQYRHHRRWLVGKTDTVIVSFLISAQVRTVNDRPLSGPHDP